MRDKSELSQYPQAIYIDSLSGLDRAVSLEVANTASKFGLCGAVPALRWALRPEKIRIYGDQFRVATEEVLADIREGRFSSQVPISIEYVVSAIEWVFRLPNSVEVDDINVSQKSD
jgi:NADP-dependent 3-hydroxy acid dehydrogenase YdfG